MAAYGAAMKPRRHEQARPGRVPAVSRSRPGRVQCNDLRERLAGRVLDVCNAMIPVCNAMIPMCNAMTPVCNAMNFASARWKVCNAMTTWARSYWRRA